MFIPPGQNCLSIPPLSLVCQVAGSGVGAQGLQGGQGCSPGQAHSKGSLPGRGKVGKGVVGGNKGKKGRAPNRPFLSVHLFL